MGPPDTVKALACCKFALNFIHFFLFSFGSWCSESHHFLPSWLVTAGKMRDFWGQMCFHSTIIMPLKILIALAVFLGGPWAGWEDSGSECLQQLKEVRNMFPPFTQDVLLQSLGDLPAQCSELVTTVKNKDTIHRHYAFCPPGAEC